jgi:phage terminase large subunit-like protein
VIYETLTSEDWKSPAVWKKANPNLGVSVSLDYIASECKRAIEIPRMENTFKRLHLNMLTETADRWLSVESWDASDGEIYEPELAGQACWCGLDLSTTTDLSALAMVFLDGDRRYKVLCRFWVPAENVLARSRRDNVPYDTWISQGWITATPGNCVDYTRIRADINALGRQYEIREIATDRWNATQLITELAGDGFTIFAFGQGYKDMSSPSKELERAVIAGDVRAGRNPVLRWMIGNAASDTDAAGNVKPTKAKSTGRIDGVVAMVMGIARASLNGSGYNSCYERMDGVRSL